MSQIPPEIESLIWSVAESGDPQAITEFQARFPQHRLELMKRVNAIGDLRRARVAPTSKAPAFSPKEARPFLLKRPLTFALAAITLSALALGSYLGVYKKVADPPPIKPLTAGASCEEPRMRYPLVPMAPPKSTPPVTPSPAPIVVPHLTKPEEVPITLHIDRTELHVVLDALAERAGWSLTFAPGAPDPDIRVDYDDISIVDIVKDMGRRYGFSAVDEGDHKVFIIPVSDSNGPTNAGPPLDKESQPTKTTDGDSPIHSIPGVVR